MRWRHFEPGWEEEEAARRAVEAAMDRFWEDFQDGLDWFEGQLRTGGPAEEWLTPLLHRLHPSLSWEVGPGWRLTITPEDDRALRPMVEELLARAPALPGWSFTAWRPPVPAADAAGVYQARTGSPLGRLSFTARRGEHHRVDLGFDARPQLGFVACEVLLGEEVLDRWIGEIRRVAAPGLLPRLRSRGPRLRPLAQLAEVVAAQQAGVRTRLPDRPLHELHPSPVVTLYERMPPHQHEYERRDDVLTGSSYLPEMIRATLDGPDSFYSGRFSACGEVFAYLKLEGTDRLGEFEDRVQVEAAVDARLATTRCGRAVGGATGLRYSYVDLALHDVPQALLRVRDLLQRCRVPRRAWIQFFDPDLAHEWVAIWPGGPPPPGMRPD